MKRPKTFLEQLDDLPEAPGLKPQLTADEVMPRKRDVRQCELIISPSAIRLAETYFYGRRKMAVPDAKFSNFRRATA